MDDATFDGVPDPGLEVVSSEKDVYMKALKYLRAGTRIVRAVYPDDGAIHVMTLDVDGALHSQVLNADATLDGGVVPPGFSLRACDVFPD